jgi:hypothetical protein
MRYYFIPSWSGDFRIERVSDTTSALTVVDPTAGDAARLYPFLAKLHEFGHIGPKAGKIKPKGETRIELPLTVIAAGQLLAAACTDAKSSWTALRFTDGTVEVVDGNVAPVTTPTPVEAAATVAQPMRGCPEPEPATRRASTVLRTFCTGGQWHDFQRFGFMRVVGNATGRTYRVYHDDEAAKRGLSHSLEVEGGDTICCWDASVPAEEQALALKLAVEHREAWLLKLGEN